MHIDTKYNIGDKVWAYVEDEPKEYEVLSIDIGITPSSQRTYYTIEVGLDRGGIAENCIFPSKEELLKSLQ